MEISMWNIEEMTGYVPKTTFWMDFSIADKFGRNAVLDTYQRAFDNWKDDPIYLTELVMVLNWKLWEHHDAGNTVLAETYDKLWGEADEYAMDNLTGDDLSYFLSTTD